MTNLTVAILAHVSRSHKAICAAVQQQGVTPAVFASTYPLTFRRDPAKKYLGVFTNYRDIMRWAMEQPDEWVVILHDDVVLPAGALDKMDHVLGFATRDLVSFYNPDNKTYREALARGLHVVESAANFWTQCLALRCRAIGPIYEWGTEHVIPGTLAEDGYLWRYCTRTVTVAQIVVPSFVQHDLSIASTFGHAAKMGKTTRQSATYDPTFDPWQVDWARAFAAPFKDTRKYRDTFGLK